MRSSERYEMGSEGSTSSVSSPAAARPIPFLQPRKTPKLSSLSLSPPKDIDNGCLDRPPTTPPFSVLRPVKTPRTRSSSAPCVLRQSSDLDRPLKIYQPSSLPSGSLHSDALGLALMLEPEHRNNGYRIRATTEQTGELQPSDAVVSVTLPDVSHPCSSGRRLLQTAILTSVCTTSSLPLSLLQSFDPDLSIPTAVSLNLPR